MGTSGLGLGLRGRFWEIDRDYEGFLRARRRIQRDLLRSKRAMTIALGITGSCSIMMGKRKGQSWKPKTEVETPKGHLKIRAVLQGPCIGFHVGMWEASLKPYQVSHPLKF